MLFSTHTLFSKNLSSMVGYLLGFHFVFIYLKFFSYFEELHLIPIFGQALKGLLSFSFSLSHQSLLLHDHNIEPATIISPTFKVPL